jgi:hypothetical protein
VSVFSDSPERADLFSRAPPTLHRTFSPAAVVAVARILRVTRGFLRFPPMVNHTINTASASATKASSNSHSIGSPFHQLLAALLIASSPVA